MQGFVACDATSSATARAQISRCWRCRSACSRRTNSVCPAPAEPVSAAKPSYCLNIVVLIASGQTNKQASTVHTTADMQDPVTSALLSEEACCSEQADELSATVHVRSTESITGGNTPMNSNATNHMLLTNMAHAAQQQQSCPMGTFQTWAWSAATHKQNGDE